MSITSTLTVNNTWQPIFGVPSTGYCQVQVIENFVGGRTANFNLNTYTDSSSTQVTELVDCRGFTYFDPFLPANFSLDGVIQYQLRRTSNILEITVSSGSYNLTFNSYSASQGLLRGPQGPQGRQGAQGVTGAQGPVGSPGLPRDTTFAVMSSQVDIGTANAYLLPSGTTATLSAAQVLVSLGSALSLTVRLTAPPGVGQSRTVQVRFGPAGIATTALVTISDLNTTGQWTGSVTISNSIVLLATATASAANSTVMATVHFTK